MVAPGRSPVSSGGAAAEGGPPAALQSCLSDLPAHTPARWGAARRAAEPLPESETPRAALKRQACAASTGEAEPERGPGRDAVTEENADADRRAAIARVAPPRELACRLLVAVALCPLSPSSTPADTTRSGSARSRRPLCASPINTSALSHAMRPATRAVFLLLLVCVAILALTAKADEDPWADIVDEGEPAVARKGTWASDDAQKEAKKKDDKPASFLQRHGMVVMYVGVLLFNKLLRHFKGGNAEAGAAPGGNVKAVHNDAEWKALIDASKETKQLVRGSSAPMNRAVRDVQSAVCLVSASPILTLTTQRGLPEAHMQCAVTASRVSISRRCNKPPAARSPLFPGRPGCGFDQPST